ncbi:S-layer homology domain-containing protein [Mesobacillus subterraneus]|uniref:S-layer homology domain-containing protein n=1 Tax=Mesobacillus subterraneus TaxID=285983 RepID=UPI0020426B2E|nr:S-layer homology domain-containing protein [Mesobacillus subterraneus]MCM3574136.1 S-layer homology domain-containing protein [Mesobacillus subterraneus]
MRKMTVLLLAFTIVLGLHSSPSASASATFKDIDRSPMKFYIEELAKNNVISGYADGTFRPKENLTRAQFAKMLALAMELPLDSKAAAQFTDLADWSRPYVGALVKAEITYGKSKTLFGANTLITRQEMAVMFVRAMGLEEFVVLLEYDASFADIQKVSSWAQPHVAFLKDIGFIEGNGKYYFPQDPTTREAFAKLTYRFKMEELKYYELALNRIILELVEEAIDVELIDGETIEVTYDDGEIYEYEISYFMQGLYMTFQYESLAYLDGFMWQQMTSAEKNEIIMFAISYWDSEYSEYILKRPAEQAYNLLFSRLDGYYVNSINNKDNLLRTLLWSAVDTYTIDYIHQEQQ